MISSIQGALEARGPGYVIVNVGGIGLQVFVPSGTLEGLGELGRQVRLHTHLHFKEDAIALYGFGSPEELRLFRMLLGVAGLGPRTAVSALSVMSPSDLAAAIASEDIDALVRIPGVGRKTAARIVLELKAAVEKELVAFPVSATGPLDGDAVAALTALGYSQAEARAALAAVTDAGALSLEERLRRALQHMSRP